MSPDAQNIDWCEQPPDDPPDDDDDDDPVDPEFEDESSVGAWLVTTITGSWGGGAGAC